MRMAICDDLTECSIDEFKTGADLLKSDENYDILFLDIELGDLNGIAVAKEIQKRYKNTVILVVTAF